MYKRILVPVDGSDISEAALREACALAGEGGGEVRLVYVIDERAIVAGSEFGDMLGIEKAQADAAREILGRLAKNCQGAQTHLIETTSVGQGIGEAIVEEAREWGADLIVSGTHGRTGLRHLLMGSVAEGIVRSSAVPVLLVKA